MLKTMRLTSLLQTDPLIRYNKQRIETLASVIDIDQKSFFQHHQDLRNATEHSISRARLVVLRNRMRRLFEITLGNDKQMSALMGVIRHRVSVLTRRVGFESNILIPKLRKGFAGYEMIYGLSRPKAEYQGVNDYTLINFDHSRPILPQIGCFN